MRMLYEIKGDTGGGQMSDWKVVGGDIMKNLIINIMFAILLICTLGIVVGAYIESRFKKK